MFAGLYAKREGQRDNYFANYVISTKIISGIFSTTVHLRQHFGFIKPNSLNSAVTLTFILDNNSKQNRETVVRKTVVRVMTQLPVFPRN